MKTGIFFLLCLSLLTACGQKTGANTAVQADTQTGNNAFVKVNTAALQQKTHTSELLEWPEAMSIIQVDMGYVPWPDINPEAITEINAGGDVSNTFVLSSGGFLTCELVSEAEDSFPRVQCYDTNRKKRWTKDYTHLRIPAGNRSSCFTAFPDGRFAFSLNSRVFMCDSEGGVEWECDLTNMPIRALLHDSTGVLFALGNWNQYPAARGDAYDSGPTDITAARIEPDGHVSIHKSYGGLDFDELLYAVYHEETGIVIEGRTQSTDGDFAARGFDYFIATLNPVDLSLRWVYIPAVDELLSISFYECIVKDGFIYGFVTDGYGDIPHENKTTYLCKLNNKGQEIWRTALFVNNDPQAFTIIDRETLLITAKDLFLLVDTEGRIVRRAEGETYNAGRLWPLAQGGFVASFVRPVKAIPQPVYISSSWFDTETVVTRYDSHFAVVWRKTYNTYPDRLEVTHVYALPDGALWVEQK